MCSVNVNFFVVIVVFVICYIPRIYTQILWPCLLSSIFFFFLRGKGKGDKIKAHEMERNKVVICVAFRGFHVEIEWTRVTDRSKCNSKRENSPRRWVLAALLESVSSQGCRQGKTHLEVHVVFLNIYILIMLITLSSTFIYILSVSFTSFYSLSHQVCYMQNEYVRLTRSLVCWGNFLFE